MARRKSRRLKALAREYGVTGAARLLQRAHSTVSAWLSRGVPQGREIEIENLWRQLKQSRDLAKEELATFETLRKLAGEADLMPRFRGGQSERSGGNTIGWQWKKSFKRLLTPRLAEQIYAWASKVRSKRHSLWQAMAVTSQYAVVTSAPFHGSGDPLVYQLDHPRTGEFTPEALIVGSRESRIPAMRTFRQKLLEAANDDAVKTFVHGGIVTNYDFRNPEYIARRRAPRKPLGMHAAAELRKQRKRRN